MNIREGQAPPKLDRETFAKRFRARFQDPMFDAVAAQIITLEEIAWCAYSEGRKAPRTQAGGAEFADPRYELSLEWLDTRQRLRDAARRWADPATPDRVLVVNGAARNDGTCPSEASKSFRLVNLAREAFVERGVRDVDVLDLSLLSSEYGRAIHPCKACVSTAMPMCHWPCSCYPNHSLGQTGDWMAEIYERFTQAHAILFVTPVYWFQAPSGLKLLIDRLVCADGGNPDPSTTQGKDPKLAKKLELAGWDYPKHLAGRGYGVIVHGDVEGTDNLRRMLCDWLDAMGLVDAGPFSRLDRYIGYYETYARSHEALDRDDELQEEVRNVARAIAAALPALRKARAPERALQAPREK